jgi:hypothetical protein
MALGVRNRQKNYWQAHFMCSSSVAFQKVMMISIGAGSLHAESHKFRIRVPGMGLKKTSTGTRNDHLTPNPVKNTSKKN